MLTSHVKFHSVNGKRQILIVDDEQVNRELLGYIAASNFDVLYASDGVSALKLMEVQINCNSGGIENDI